MDLLQSLRGPYLASVKERVADLETQVRRARDQAAFKELQRMAHSLRGSSGFYGFSDIYAAASNMEDLFKAAIADPTLVPESDLVAVARALVRAVEIAELPAEGRTETP